MANMQEDIAKALNRSYFYLKFRPRTEHEVRIYLHKKSEQFYHWSPEVIDATIAELKNLNFINDRKFVDSFVATRIAIKPKGEFVLRQELLRHGVNKDILDDYFAENPLDQEALARQILETRWTRYQRLDRKTRFEKAAQFLMRRGFSFSVAKKAIQEVK